MDGLTSFVEWCLANFPVIIKKDFAEVPVHSNVDNWDWALPAVICSFVVILAFLAYSGLFHRIKVELNHSHRPKITFAYIFDFGGYREAAIRLDQYRLLYPQLPRITILYNSPIYPQSNRERLPTFATGLVVSEGTYEVPCRIYAKLIELGFSFSTIPDDCFSVTTKFVHHNHLSLLFASQRIFKPFIKCVQERRLCAHPLVQVDKNSMLHIFAPLGSQLDYYVMEASNYYGIPLVHKANRYKVMSSTNGLLHAH